MGLAIAAELASRGIHVAVGARRGADENLAAVAREAIGGDCLVASRWWHFAVQRPPPASPWKIFRLMRGRFGNAGKAAIFQKLRVNL